MFFLSVISFHGSRIRLCVYTTGACAWTWARPEYVRQIRKISKISQVAQEIGAITSSAQDAIFRARNYTVNWDGS